MTVTGINSDLYYSNNPIFITFSEINANANYIEIFPSTIGISASTIRPQRLYVFGQTSITIDISQTVKLFFQDIAHNTNYTILTPFTVLNNWRKVTFIIKEVLNNGTVNNVPSISKTFVRGGNHTYNSNQKTSVNLLLSPCSTIPVWGGYPIDYYYFNSSKLMEKSNVIPVTYKEQRKIKGCDPLYIKFLNSKGGYSYWLFETWEYEVSSKNIGVVKSTERIKDLGNESESLISVISKVPKRYMPLMFDLADSQEIYIYKGKALYESNDTWYQVTSKNNKVSQNKFNTNEKVKLKFDVVNRYNASSIW